MFDKAVRTPVLVSHEASTLAMASFHEAAFPGATLSHDAQLDPLKRGWTAAVSAMADEARWAAEKAARSHGRSFLERGDDEPTPSAAHRVLLDAIAKLTQDLEGVGGEDVFPNFAELPVSLPAGHWRQLLAILAVLGQTVPDVATLLPPDTAA